jgi:signal transduction histidine kinase
MLRLLVLVLLLANGGSYAWSHGLLRTYGFGPALQAEPQRVAQQIQPQLLRVLSSDEARRADAASRPLECLQAGLFDDAQASALRQLNERLQSLDKLKDDFMSSVTHELRTPLASIRALAELMRDEPEMEPGQRQQFSF